MNAKKVLLADDEQDLRNLLARFLEMNGFEVRSVSSGNHAIACLESFAPDCIVSDIRMPDGSGYELLDRVRRLPPPPIPVLLISGFARMDEKLPEGEPPSFEFLAKPFDLKIFHDRVRSLCRAGER